MYRLSVCAARCRDAAMFAPTSLRRDDAHFALQMQRGAIDQARGKQRARMRHRLRASVDFAFLDNCRPRASPVARRDRCRAEALRRAANDGGMSGQIDGVGNDGGGGIGLRRRSRQHGHGIGDAERETAPVAAAGRNAARRIIGRQSGRSHHAEPVRPIHQADGKPLTVRKMQRDVAAIVDIGALKPRLLAPSRREFLRRRCPRPPPSG